MGAKYSDSFIVRILMCSVATALMLCSNLQLVELLASVRRFVHTLWSYHLAMVDGFEDDVLSVLQLK